MPCCTLFKPCCAFFVQPPRIFFTGLQALLVQVLASCSLLLDEMQSSRKLCCIGCHRSERFEFLRNRRNLLIPQLALCTMLLDLCPRSCCLSPRSCCPILHII